MCQCQRIGCGAPGTQALKVVIPSASGLRATAAEGLLGVVMCDDHFNEAEIQEDFLMHPAVQMLFQRVLDDAAKPDWSEAYLVAVPVGSAEFKAWREMDATVH